MKPKLNGLLAMAVFKFVRNCICDLLSAKRSDCKSACDARGWKPQAKEEKKKVVNK